MTPSARIIRPELFDTNWSQTWTKSGHVVSLETGWYEDTIRVVLDPSVPFQNSDRRHFPEGFETCNTTNIGYQLDPKDPGIKVHEAALLSAFVAHKKVSLLISGCAFDKPRVIAVDLTD